MSIDELVIQTRTLDVVALQSPALVIWRCVPLRPLVVEVDDDHAAGVLFWPDNAVDDDDADDDDEDDDDDDDDSSDDDDYGGGWHTVHEHAELGFHKIDRYGATLCKYHVGATYIPGDKSVHKILWDSGSVEYGL